MEGLLADTSSADLSAIDPVDELTPQGRANAESVELLREFERTGRAQPFEALMRRHAPMVYATCLKVTRDPHDAEDATQATFLTLAAKGKLNGEIRSPEAWLRKVAHRLSLDLIRSKKRRSNRETIKGEMVSEVQQLDSHDHADSAEAKRILSEELAKMPAGYRMPLVLHYFGGLSRDEMAAQLKVKPSTLGVRLHRAREQLRKRLRARGVAMPAAVLGVLLTETVRGRITDALIGSTSVKASLVALGSHSYSSTGLSASLAGASSLLPIGMTASVVRSVRSLLNTVLSSKIKLAGVLAIAGTLISASTAKVIGYLPELFRQIVPSFSAPTIPLPTLDMPALPRLTQADAPAAEPMPYVSGSIDAQLASLQTKPAAINTAAVYAAESTAPSAPSTSSTTFASLTPTPVATSIAAASSRAAQQVRSGPSSSSVGLPTQFASPALVTPTSRTPAIARPAIATPQPAVTTFVNASLADVRRSAAHAGTRRDTWNASMALSATDSPGSPLVRAGVDQPSAVDLASPHTVGASIGSLPAVGGTQAAAGWSLARSADANSAAASTSTVSDAVDRQAIATQWHAAPGGGLTTSFTWPAATDSISSAGSTASLDVVAKGGSSSVTAPPAAISTQVAADDSAYRVIRYVDASSVVGGFDSDCLEPKSLTDSSQSLGGIGAATTSAAYYALRPTFDGVSGTHDSINDQDADDVAMPPNPLGAPLGPNSARIALRGSTADAAIDYLDTSDASLPAFPPNHTFFGVWKLETSGTFDGVDLLVRYDDLRAARLGLHEYAVKIWVSDGVTWTNLLNDPTFGRDTTANLVWANYTGGDVRYFAVSTPEPAAMLVVGAIGAMALKRRRRV